MTEPAASKLQNFRAASTGFEEIQRQILADIIGRNATTAYGRLHNFSAVLGSGDYSGLPFMTYDRVDGIDGYWDTPDNFSSDRLIAYFLTSGSSSDPKKIPVTSSLVREKARAFGVFWESIYAAHPELKGGHFIANFADSGNSQRNERGVLEIAETTFWNQRMQGFQDASRWPAGKYLTAIKSAKLRYYAAVRLALQGPLHCMMSLNPSTLVKLCDVIGDDSARLVRGLLDGRWGIEDLDSDLSLPAELTCALEKNASAAQSLKKACASTGSFFQLRDVWPELELIICWQSDLVEPFLRLLRRHADGVDFRDYITQSSECIIAVPLEDNMSGGLLAYTSHFFEFIPESQFDAPTPETIPAWEIEQGQQYEVVVTTGGGLYRYRTGDCILVTGFDGDVPRVSFQYRLGRTSSITGEKLTEQQVLMALGRVRTKHGIETTDIVVFPRTGDRPHYGLMLPKASMPEHQDDDKIADLVVTFDSALKLANGEYKDKRESLRLAEPRLILVDSSEFDALQQKFRAAHVGDDQFKPGVLRKERDLDAGMLAVEEIRADC